MAQYYVTMTDDFMSNWGKSEGKKNKMIFICKDYNEAQTVAQNAKNRGDQKNINITTKKPYYNPETHYTQIKTREEYPKWYKPGAF